LIELKSALFQKAKYASIERLFSISQILSSTGSEGDLNFNDFHLTCFFRDIFGGNSYTHVFLDMDTSLQTERHEIAPILDLGFSFRKIRNRVVC
jgi:hypothetical protein